MSALLLDRLELLLFVDVRWLAAFVAVPFVLCPGNALAATAVNAAVSAALPASSQRLAWASRRNAASRVRVVCGFWILMGGGDGLGISTGSTEIACVQCAGRLKALTKAPVRSSIEVVCAAPVV
ncbi:MAG TPA: hypothetical protein VGI76_02655 [Solirubrobacteraceae bacterium]